MGRRFRVDQLGGNAQAIARLAHAAFKHITRAKLHADLFHVDLLAFVGKGRIACDHWKLTPEGKCCDQIFGDAVSEKFLIFVTAHIVERQYC